MKKSFLSILILAVIEIGGCQAFGQTTIPWSDIESANSATVAGKITDETGSGALVFATGPTFGSATFTGAIAASSSINITRTGAANGVTVQQTGDTQPRFLADAGGALRWGAGNATVDASLYRSAAGALTTDSKLFALKPATGDNSTQVPTTSWVEERALLGAASRANAPSLIADGATSGRSLIWSPGTQGNVAGMSATFVDCFEVPSTNPSTNAFVATLSSTTNLAAANANQADIYINTTGSLRIQIYGATTSDYRRFEYPAFLSTYAGRLVRLVVVFQTGDSTTAPKVYIDGDDKSSAFTETTAGAATNWMPAALDCSKFLSGYNWPTGRLIADAEFGLGIWSATEAQTYGKTGLKPFWWRIGTGSAVAKNTTAMGNSDAVITGFASTATSWSGTVTTYSTVRLKNASGDIVLQAGRKYRFDYTVVSSPGTCYLQTPGSAVATLSATPGTYSVEFTAPNSSLIYFYPLTTGAYSYTGCQLRDLGPIFKPVVQPSGSLGGVLRDAGANKIPGYYTSGMVPVTSDNRGAIRYRLTWSGTHEAKAVIADQALIPDDARIDSITLNSDASTSGSGVTINDGDTTSYWAAATPLTANTKTDVTPAHRYPASSAAADLKIQVDPDTANFTGNIDVTINYSLTN